MDLHDIGAAGDCFRAYAGIGIDDSVAADEFPTDVVSRHRSSCTKIAVGGSQSESVLEVDDVRIPPTRREVEDGVERRVSGIPGRCVHEMVIAVPAEQLVGS